MEHRMSELYIYEDRRYNAEALSNVIGYNVATMKYRQLQVIGVKRMSGKTCNYKTSNRASFTYYGSNDIQTAWQFGEHTFFDTEAERDAMREAHKASMAQSHYRTELLKKINTLSTENLEKIVQVFERRLGK